MLSKAVNSILQQSFDDWEAIVVDDGSLPKSKQIVEDFDDERIQYYYKTNGGLASARNFGIERAKGNYLCYLDDDDLYAPHFFDTIFKHAEKDKILVFAYEMRELNGAFIRTVSPGAEDIFVKKYIEESYSPIPFVYPNELAKSRRFDEDDLVYEDVPYILPLIAQNSLKCIDTISCTVHRHKERITGTKYDKYKEQMYEQVRDNICRVIVSLQEYLPYSDSELNAIVYSKYDELLKGTAQVDWEYLPTILDQIKRDYPDYKAPSNLDLRVKWIKAGIKKLLGK